MKGFINIFHVPMLQKLKCLFELFKWHERNVVLFTIIIDAESSGIISLYACVHEYSILTMYVNRW